MESLTLETLVKCCPGLPLPRAALYLPHLKAALLEAGIDTPKRLAAFLSQVGHESGSFRWLQEIWGPTPQQLKYEPPSSLAKTLGNTEKGDGYRYRGRGSLQLTGRANYVKAGKDLGIDLEGNPDLAAAPEHAFRIAGWYWKKHGLNDLADSGDFEKITRKINGGLTGQPDRLKRYELAKKALGVP